MNIDTQMMTIEEYTGAIQLLGILLYFLLPTLVVIMIVYGIRKVLRKKSKAENRNKQSNKKCNVNSNETFINGSRRTKLDINNASNKELSHRIDTIEKEMRPERTGSLTLTFDKDGKIEQ